MTLDRQDDGRHSGQADVNAGRRPGGAGRRGGVRPGDPESVYARLVQDHWQAVYRFMWGMTGDHHVAEDLTQDAYTAALAHLADLRDPERGPAWLFTIAANTARRHFRGRRAPLDPGLSTAARDLDGSLDLCQALEALTSDDREILLLVGLVGYSPPEAGSILGIGAEAAYKRWQRARARLRRALEGDGHGL